MCGREWTMHGAKKPKDNDELVWCEGGCEHWYHQKCHDPPIMPIPKGKFCCADCTQVMTMEHDAEDDLGVPPPPRRLARKGKVPEKSSARIKASGIGKPGVMNENNKLPKRMPGGKNEGSRLDKMAWSHPVAQPKKKAKKRNTSPSTSPSNTPPPSPVNSNSPSQSPSPEQPHEWGTTAGKRVRKKPGHFNVLTDGANDTTLLGKSSKNPKK